MKKALSALALLATLATALVGFQRLAFADLFSRCGVRAGSTRFWDSATNACSYVYYDNVYWGSFGWNDRADQFGNDGITSTNCLYPDYYYQGTPVTLPRGYAVTWYNTVSSNLWTTGSCPR